MTERMTLLQHLSKRVGEWDGTAGTAAVLIAACKPLVNELATLADRPYTPEEKQMMEAIAFRQGEMIAAIGAEKAAIAAELRALNKKEAVVQNYLYPKRQPIFVNQQL